MKKYFALFLCCILICCKAPKEYTIDNYNGKILSFGTQGGFANEVIEFRLYENGHLEKYKIRSQSTETMQRLDSDQCKQIFDNFYSLGCDKIVLDAPGNMNYYINMKDGESTTKLLWGDHDQQAPEIIKQYFKVLGQLAKQSKIN